jgi:hypothetical protein
MEPAEIVVRLGMGSELVVRPDGMELTAGLLRSEQPLHAGRTC